ncbi:MAG: hypothetical protein GY757_31200 [bacterium]|nr:hypothetical protein [bacterium]
MDIYVNGNKIDFKPFFPLTWGNLFQKLLQSPDYIQKDHGIVGIMADNVDSLHVMTEESNKMVPESIGVLQLSTKNSLDITRGGFQKAVTLVNNIKTEINGAADLLREGNIEEASSKIAKIMEAIRPMIDFVNSVGMSFSMNFDEIEFKQGTTLRVQIESFLSSFTEMISIQEKQDFVELADFLEYQLCEDMEDWAKLFNILLREAEAYHAKNA